MKISQLIENFLFDNKFGYYKTKNPIGKDSDFITAPEISQIFGEIIAVYLLHISENSISKNSDKISLVEMGAGKGTLFRDILQTIENLARNGNKTATDFLSKAQFHLIEINPVLEKVQQNNLKDFLITWHRNFVDFLSSNQSKIFFISNELFDCFAIDQYVKTKSGWCERLVDFEDKNNLTKPRFFLAKTTPATNHFVKEKIGDYFSEIAPLNAVFEYSKSAQEFMQELCKALKEQGGIAINFDYGYDSYDFGNTLQFIKNHQKISCPQEWRDIDITAHVDFLALNKIAKNYDLNTSLVTQSEFLISLGALERVAKLIKHNPQKKVEIESSLNRLIDKEAMGDLFKVHIIWK